MNESIDDPLYQLGRNTSPEYQELRTTKLMSHLNYMLIPGEIRFYSRCTAVWETTNYTLTINHDTGGKKKKKDGKLYNGS